MAAAKKRGGKRRPDQAQADAPPKPKRTPKKKKRVRTPGKRSGAEPASKFTPARKAAILKRIARGNYPLEAARAEGVVENTWRNWRRRAAAGEKEYVQFFDQVDQAEAQGECDRVEATARAAHPEPLQVICPDCEKPVIVPPEALSGASEMHLILYRAAKAATDHLARRHPKRWSSVVKHTVAEQQDEFLDVAERVLPAEWFDKLLTAYLADRSGEQEQQRTDAPQGQSLH